MTIRLTEEQRREVEGSNGPAEVVDSLTGERYRLVPWEEYEDLTDERFQAALVRLSMETMAKSFADEPWDEPKEVLKAEEATA